MPCTLNRVQVKGEKKKETYHQHCQPPAKSKGRRRRRPTISIVSHQLSQRGEEEGDLPSALSATSQVKGEKKKETYHQHCQPPAESKGRRRRRPTIRIVSHQLSQRGEEEGDLPSALSATSWLKGEKKKETYHQHCQPPAESKGRRRRRPTIRIVSHQPSQRGEEEGDLPSALSATSWVKGEKKKETYHQHCQPPAESKGRRRRRPTISIVSHQLSQRGEEEGDLPSALSATSWVKGEKKKETYHQHCQPPAESKGRRRRRPTISIVSHQLSQRGEEEGDLPSALSATSWVKGEKKKETYHPHCQPPAESKGRRRRRPTISIVSHQLSQRGEEEGDLPSALSATSWVKGEKKKETYHQHCQPPAESKGRRRRRPTIRIVSHQLWQWLLQCWRQTQQSEVAGDVEGEVNQPRKRVYENSCLRTWLPEMRRNKSCAGAVTTEGSQLPERFSQSGWHIQHTWINRQFSAAWALQPIRMAHSTHMN